MAVDWGLSKADPDSYQPIEAEPFEPHPFDPEEIDVMLVGAMNGPIMEAFEQIIEISSDGSHSVGILATDAVKKWAVRLAAIKRSDFAPMAVVLRESSHAVEKKDERDFYNDLAALAERLQRFVVEAADQNCAICLEVSC